MKIKFKIKFSKLFYFSKNKKRMSAILIKEKIATNNTHTHTLNGTEHKNIKP